MKEVAAASAALPSEKAVALAAGWTAEVEIGGAMVTVLPEDVVVNRTPKDGLVVAAENDIIVALETALTPALIHEGLAREFVNRVQNMRKTADFEVTQRIAITFTAPAEVQQAVAAFAEYVKTETLANSLQASPTQGPDATEWDINGHACAISVKV